MKSVAQNNVNVLSRRLNFILETGCDVMNRTGRDTAARRKNASSLQEPALYATANTLLLGSFHEYTCASLGPVRCQAHPDRMSRAGNKKKRKKNHSHKQRRVRKKKNVRVIDTEARRPSRRMLERGAGSGGSVGGAWGGAKQDDEDVFRWRRSWEEEIPRSSAAARPRA